MGVYIVDEVEKEMDQLLSHEPLGQIGQLIPVEDANLQVAGEQLDGTDRDVIELQNNPVSSSWVDDQIEGWVAAQCIGSWS